MGLKTMSLLDNATSTATGGTALTFATNGVGIPSGTQLVATSDSDFQTQRILTAKVKTAVLDPRTGRYGKGKKSLSLSLPQVNEDGSVIFNVWRLEEDVHPSVTAAVRENMRQIISQLVTDTDMDAFWATGSVE